VPYLDERGAYLLDLIDAQDIAAWITQGTIAKRDREKLGTTDTGIILYRSMLRREMAKVANGEDPIGTVRDVAKHATISFPLERDKAHFTDGFNSLLPARRCATRRLPAISSRSSRSTTICGRGDPEAGAGRRRLSGCNTTSVRVSNRAR